MPKRAHRVFDELLRGPGSHRQSEISVKFYFLASGFYLMVPGLSAMCMFYLNVHSRDSFALCQSLFEAQGKVLPHPPSHRASWRVLPHHAERHSFVLLKFLGTTTDNPKLDSKDDNHILFLGGLSSKYLMAKCAWRNLPGKFASRNLPGNYPAKFPGESCRKNLRRNLSAKVSAKTNC